MAPEASPVAKRRRMEMSGVFAEFGNQPKFSKPDLRPMTEKNLTGRMVLWKSGSYNLYWEVCVIKDCYFVIDRNGKCHHYKSDLCYLVDKLPKDLTFYTQNEKKRGEVVGWELAKETCIKAGEFYVNASREYDGSKVAGIRGKDMMFDDEGIKYLVKTGFAEPLGTMCLTKDMGYPSFRMTDTKRKMVASRVHRRRLNSRFSAVGTERVYVTVEREINIVNN